MIAHALHHGKGAAVSDGEAFSDAEILLAGLLGPIKNKPIQLVSGAILAPTSVESYRAWTAWVERSTDDCRTWRRFA